MNDTLFGRLWNDHVVCPIDEATDLLAVDRIYLHDLCGMFTFQMMQSMKTQPYDASRIFASPDHTLPSGCADCADGAEISARVLPVFRSGCEKYGIRLFDVGDENQGIIHVAGPESGLTLPGMTLTCGDSHTCTHGAMGCLAMGLGTSELYHAMVTGCIPVKRPKTTKIVISGRSRADVGPMDVILWIIARYGVDFGSGHAVEYTGEYVEDLPMEDRFTLCNLNVESGSEYALVAPDAETIRYLTGRPFAPKGALLEKLTRHVRELTSGIEDKAYDRIIQVDASRIGRQISWGVNPSQTVGVDGCVPVPGVGLAEKALRGYENACAYMGLQPGQPMAGLPVQRVFIGSCSNGRLSNIRTVADYVKGKHVAPHVDAWIVPGSERVWRQAEELGYARICREAGFKWGRPGCSMCVGSNGETVPAGARCVSTTNRNFIGRQGVGARTHLASPLTAAMAAINGVIS